MQSRVSDIVSKPLSPQIAPLQIMWPVEREAWMEELAAFHTKAQREAYWRNFPSMFLSSVLGW